MYIRLIQSNVAFKAIISLLVFCLSNLAIKVNGVLKSPAITVNFCFYLSLTFALCADTTVFLLIPHTLYVGEVGMCIAWWVHSSALLSHWVKFQVESPRVHMPWHPPVPAGPTIVP